jgi:hypothetical protein
MGRTAATLSQTTLNTFMFGTQAWLRGVRETEEARAAGRT